MSALKTILRFAIVPFVIFAAILALALRDQTGYVAAMAEALGQLHPHAPNLSLVAEQSVVIQVHLYTALAAIALGGFQIILPKGTPLHRIMGWVWLAFMTVIAGTSLFIKLINHGQFSLIHLLSVLVLIQVPRIIWFARKGDIKSHKRAAITLYIGALLIAGLFTFMPGRLMWQVFFG
jgi:uncharacterized membrane protein